jgi:hypothetical protein
MRDHFPSSAEAQKQIDDAKAADAAADWQGIRGMISYDQMRDRQEDAAVQRSRATRELDEATDRESGRRVPVSTRIKRALSKQIFG